MPQETTLTFKKIKLFNLISIRTTSVQTYWYIVIGIIYKDYNSETCKYDCIVRIDRCNEYQINAETVQYKSYKTVQIE